MNANPVTCFVLLATMDSRELMIERQLKARGISSEAVLEAMRRVAREQFVAPELKEYAYEDRPLIIGCSQTISQPYIVASMLQALELKSGDRALELGTGSGYQTALLCEIVHEVVSIERHPMLAQLAQEHLSSLGYRNFEIVVGDGTVGYRPRAPYDAVIVSAAAPEIPHSLIEQLAVGGRMVLPVGSRELQDLILVTKSEAGIFRTRLDGCAFVPLIGQEGFQE